MLRPLVNLAYETQIPSSSARDFDFERLPEACVHVYFVAEVSSRGGALERGTLRVEGPNNRLRQVMRAPVSVFMQGVELEIGAARRVLGVSAASLFGGAFSLEDVWGRRRADELLDRMLSARGPAARKLVLADALLARARASTPPPRTVRAALRLIEQTRGPVRVADIAATIGVSSRQLQRHFIDEVGCAPKRYARIARLRRLVLSHDEQAPFSWADRSAELGYADQAHLISDFRAMMGAPPERLLGRGDFVAEHLRDGWFLTPRVSDFHKTA